MTRTTLTPTASGAQNGSVGATRGMVTVDFDRVDLEVGISPNQAREEVDDACKDMEMFHGMEPDEIMRRISGHSARLSTIRVRAMRTEDYHREWKDVRQRELEPTLDQLKIQYDIASRLHSVREFDYKVETGER